MPSPPTTVISQPVAALRPAERNARTHSKSQIAQIAASIRAFGFVNPVLVDGGNRIIAGHGRVAAAARLGMAQVPTLRVDHLTPAQIRAYMIADNRIAELAGWDKEILALEFGELVTIDGDLDLAVTGFAHAEIDLMIGAQDTAAVPDDEEADADPEAPVVTVPGDLWVLGGHKVLCGDVRGCRDRSANRGFGACECETDWTWGGKHALLGVWRAHRHTTGNASRFAGLWVVRTPILALPRQEPSHAPSSTDQSAYRQDRTGALDAAFALNQAGPAPGPAESTAGRQPRRPDGRLRLATAQRPGIPRRHREEETRSGAAVLQTRGQGALLPHCDAPRPLTWPNR
jgi:ParB-like nuclease domain